MSSQPISSVSLKPVLNHVICPGASSSNSATHRMAYWSWGDPYAERVLICVHGLSRQGRDFDVLARSLCDHYHVVCPDVAGRGESDWLADPASYQVFSYASDMVVLMQHLRAQRQATVPIEVDWVGTSMGGLIGLGFSTVPPEVSGAKLRKFVLNDVGPKLRYDALVRIGEYIGKPLVFVSEQEAADYLWSISTGFGSHTPEQWMALSRHMLRPAPGGQGFVLHYDPAIGEPFRSLSPETASSGEAALWQIYDAMSCQVLLLRGEDSDLLDTETARSMTERGPRASLLEFPGVGHAPTLVTADQVSAVRDFLLA